jgi:hypothetical protein
VAGVAADRLGMSAAINLVAVLTALSGIIVLVRMRETRHNVAVRRARDTPMGY